MKFKTFPKMCLLGIAFALSTAVVDASAEIIFEENFNEQPDWTADRLIRSIFSAPKDWYAGRSDPVWSPATKFQSKHATAEILSTNWDKARNKSGKSFVAWRESYAPPGDWVKFNSDGLILKYFPGGYDELYAEFWITLSDEMINSYYQGTVGQSKIFRVYHFNGNENSVFDYFGDENKPSFNWDISGSTKYGIRNFQAYLARGKNDIGRFVKGLPKGASMQGSGDVSLWYSSSATGGMGVGGKSPKLQDYKTGGVITSGPIHIDQLFGDQDQWVKIAFYVKMNSAPGVANGELMQFINDERVLHTTSIPWIRDGFDMVKWNTVGIGGNDAFRLYSNSERYEDWYAIDDVVIRSDLPPRLKDSRFSPPSSPEGIEVK